MLSRLSRVGSTGCRQAARVARIPEESAADDITLVNVKFKETCQKSTTQAIYIFCFLLLLYSIHRLTSTLPPILTMAAATFFTALAGVVAVIGLAIFLFGIPPELKRKMERAALKTIGENKLSYVAKGKLISRPTRTYTVLMPHRPDQQDPYLRPDRPSPAQEGCLQYRRWRDPESAWRHSRRGCRQPYKPFHRSLTCLCLSCEPQATYRILCSGVPAPR